MVGQRTLETELAKLPERPTDEQIAAMLTDVFDLIRDKMDQAQTEERLGMRRQPIGLDEAQRLMNLIAPAAA